MEGRYIRRSTSASEIGTKDDVGVSRMSQVNSPSGSSGHAERERHASPMAAARNSSPAHDSKSDGALANGKAWSRFCPQGKT